MFNGSFCFSRSPVNTGSFDGSTEKSPTDGKNCHRQCRYRPRRPAIVPPLVIVVVTPRGEKGFERSGKRFPGLSLFTFSSAISLTTIQLLCRICPFIIPFCSPLARSLGPLRRSSVANSRGPREGGACGYLRKERSLLRENRESAKRRKDRRSENPRTRGMLDERATICDRAARGKYLRGKQRARRID